MVWHIVSSEQYSWYVRELTGRQFRTPGHSLSCCFFVACGPVHAKVAWFLLFLVFAFCVTTGPRLYVMFSGYMKAIFYLYGAGFEGSVCSGALTSHDSLLLARPSGCLVTGCFCAGGGCDFFHFRVNLPAGDTARRFACAFRVVWSARV